MPFIDAAEASDLRSKMLNDPSRLGKLFKSYSNNYMTKSVEHSLVDSYVKDGWIVDKELKTKTKIKKEKSHSSIFEHDMWCQLYMLGYRNLNMDDQFYLPYGKEAHEKQQIDVVAVNDDTILLVECKSAASKRKAPSFKSDFESLGQKLDGFKKSLDQIFGPGRKIKYIFATRNLRVPAGSVDIQRLEDAGGFYFNDNTFDYTKSLLKSYKDSAYYQFIPLLFKGQDINKEKIEIPAIEGKMGKDVTYYMFSIQPELLLKIGFVLHRTRANQAEMPTYQRLLVPSRLKGISDFLDDGGYFPNSIIINFDAERSKKMEFQPHAKLSGSNARTGVLKLPNAYAIAYIIDGQHRVYGYAHSEFKNKDTIPVVALKGLPPHDQLKIFMDINQNQKAVSPTLRITLEEDLFWNAARLDSRMRALRSSIVSQLSSDSGSPLNSLISIGEDKGRLTASPFYEGLLHSGLLPKAQGNSFKDGTTEASLYDVNNTNHNEAMTNAKKKVFEFVAQAFDYVQSQCAGKGFDSAYDDLICVNRGSYGFLRLLGALNKYLFEKNKVSLATSTEERLGELKPFLDALVDHIGKIPDAARDFLIQSKGTAAQTNWSMYFQKVVHEKFPSFEPRELSDWNERQDEELQERARTLGTAIERHMKDVVISNLKSLFGSEWELEIGSIQRACEDRAKREMEMAYKQKLPVKEVSWTEMFFIKDYGEIIEKYFKREPEPHNPSFKTFEQHFAMDIGHGFNSKAEKLKWINLLNSYRANWAHEGTKEKRLVRAEVDTIELIASKLGIRP